jgi:hypothetical protein
MPPVNSVDAGLMQKKRLNSLEEQNRAANELRDARRPSLTRDDAELGNMTFRQQVKAAAKGMGQPGAGQKPSMAAVAGAGGNKAKMGTSQALKASWLNVIDSFGATLIYINFHAFARLIPGLRGMFCKLGEEWLPKGVSAESAPSLAGKIKNIGLLEKLLLFLVDSLLLLVIGFVCFILFIIVDFVTANWWDKAMKVLSIFSNVFKDIVFK